MEKNEIRELPEDLKGLRLLNYLNVSKNKLEKIPTQVLTLSSLNVLLIANNLIKQIKDDEIMSLSSLQKVDLNGNPFLLTVLEHQPDFYKQLFSIKNFILNSSDESQPL